MTKIILTSTLLLLYNWCFSQTDSTKKTFIKDNYQIQYPSTWKIDTSRTMGTEFMIFAPKENDTDVFSENVNFIIQNLQGTQIDLEKYKQISEKQYSEFFSDVQIFESAIIKDHSNEFYRSSFAMTQGKFRIRITAVCFIKNEKAYLLTFTSEFANYERFKSVGEEMLNSFSIKSVELRIKNVEL
jgi:hypothetical protein